MLDIVEKLITLSMNFLTDFKILKMSIKSLNASLLSYQSTAVDWCVNNEDKCCILAYDMGLGKTVIGCGLLVAKPVKTVVMVPTSLINQWKNEIEQHTTGFNIAIYHGSNRKYRSHRDAVKQADIVITTAAVIANDIKNGIYYFRCFKRWIIDEAHKLRNSKTKVHKELQKYASGVENKVFLTGTPICNTCDDLISLICLSNLPHYNEPEIWKGMDTVKKHKVLHDIKENIVLRKTKEDTIKHILPSISVKSVYLTVENMEQKDTYNFFVNEELILRKILRMRQSLNNHKQLLEEIEELQSNVDINHSSKITSIKLKTVTEIVNNIPNDDKILIVSYFTKLLLQIPKILPYDKEQIVLFHGGLTIAERNDVLNSFKNNSNTRVLLMNLRAGGCGLNLVEANHVILMEPYWNNAEEQQAINRCYRIGQKKPVFVHKLVIENSIESWLVRLQKSKDNISNFLIENDKNMEMCDIKQQQSKVKQLFKFVKDMKIDENTKQDLQEFLQTYGL